MKILMFVIFTLFLPIYGCSKEEAKKEEAKKEEVKAESKTISSVGDSSEKPLAYVDGKPIYKEDLWGPLDKTVEMELIYQEALRRGVDKEIERQAERYKKVLVVNKFRGEILKELGQPEVSDEDIKAFYDVNYNRVRVAEIVLADKGLAEEVYQKALSDENFENLVQTYSQAPSKVNAGDLGMGQKYTDIFKDKDTGAISDIVEEDSQYKILKLLDKSPPLTEQAKQMIVLQLTRREEEKLLKEFVESLKKGRKIEIVEIKGSGQ